MPSCPVLPLPGPRPHPPSPRNLITDVSGRRIGQAADARVRTGVTVILPDARAACAVDVRGGAPGTWETDVLDGWNMVRADVLARSVARAVFAATLPPGMAGKTWHML